MMLKLLRIIFVDSKAPNESPKDLIRQQVFIAMNNVVCFAGLYGLIINYSNIFISAALLLLILNILFDLRHSLKGFFKCQLIGVLFFGLNLVLFALAKGLAWQLDRSMPGANGEWYEIVAAIIIFGKICGIFFSHPGFVEEVVEARIKEYNLTNKN